MNAETIIQAKQKTARKNYNCSFCGKPVTAGTRYWRLDVRVEEDGHSLMTQYCSHTSGGECMEIVR